MLLSPPSYEVSNSTDVQDAKGFPSGYYKYVKQMQHPAKDLELAEKIRAKQESSRRTYGYRRIKLWLDSEGIVKTPRQF